jgi:hypothetical protein
MLQEKDTISPATELSGLAYFVQSILVGRVLVDVGDEPGVDEQWVDVAMTTLRCLLAPDR